MANQDLIRAARQAVEQIRDYDGRPLDGNHPVRRALVRVQKCYGGRWPDAARDSFSALEQANQEGHETEARHHARHLSAFLRADVLGEDEAKIADQLWPDTTEAPNEPEATNDEPEPQPETASGAQYGEGSADSETAQQPDRDDQERPEDHGGGVELGRLQGDQAGPE